MKLLHWLTSLSILGIGIAYADTNSNSEFINTNNYIQDPYFGIPSGGGNKVISESQVLNQTIAQRLFSDGTWNLFTGAATTYNGTSTNPFAVFAYGASIYGQTGRVGGFSLGGLFAINNPFFSTNMNGSHVYGNPFLPTDQQISVPEGFIEYQYNNRVQADVGFIGINNNPWLSGNFQNNGLSPMATYRGAMVNVYPGAGWLLTAIAFNGMEVGAQPGFNQQTLYNTGPYQGVAGVISNTNIHNGGSQGTLAAGASYAAWDNNENLRLWAYQFANYGSLLYVDNNLKINVNNNISFNIGIQGGTDNAWANDSTDALTNNQLGQISSNFAGIQGGFNYKWFGLTIGYDTVWGPQSAYGAGAIVSPYTYSMATDPLYSTPYMAGLVDMGTAGSAIKISPSFKFLDDNLQIVPAYTVFNTSQSQWNGTQEYDMEVTYSIPQVRGLALFADYSYQQVPQSNPAGNSWLTEFMVDYTY